MESSPGAPLVIADFNLQEERYPPSTLDEVVVNFAVLLAGKITFSDYLEPYEYVSMNAGD
ncbi:hypothetical protein ABEW05_008307 [Botrytis cinerea]